MKRTGLLVLVSILVAGSAIAQIASVHAFGSYSSALSKKLFVNKAEGFGGGLELRVRLSDMLRLNLIGGWERYSIQQDSALARWNWRFWDERYAGNVRDALNSDPSLRATVDPVQYMEVVPVLATVSMVVSPFPDFSITQSLGGGVLFYTRSLYMAETWSKRFQALDYTFEYSYRNFATDKKGNPLVVVGTIALAYQLSDVFIVDASARYTDVIKTSGTLGYDQFIFGDAVTLMLGLSFSY